MNFVTSIEPPVLHMRNIVSPRRTGAEDRKYHVEAHAAIRRLVRLLLAAKNIAESRAAGLHGSQETRRLKRAVIKMQIADAQAIMDRLIFEEDALDVWQDADNTFSWLAGDLAAFLDSGHRVGAEEILAWAEGQ